MKYSFVYFGDKLFEKFNFVKYDDCENPAFENSCGTIFNTLYAEDEHQPINDAVACWSFVLFLIDEKLFFCGLRQSEITTSPLLLPVTVKGGFTADLRSSECYNCILLVVNEVPFVVSCNKEFACHSIDTSCIKGKLVQVIASESQSTLVDSGGDVYFCTPSSSPMLSLPFHHKVLEVACGKEHTMFLTLPGSIYSYGNGSRGQLGQGSIQNFEKPTLIEALDGLHFKSIAAGGWHSAAVSDCDDLYTWGWNESGQLGRPCKHCKQCNPNSTEVEEISLLPKIVEIECDSFSISSINCGSRHSAMLLSDSSVWTWGWNEYGQLGVDAYPCCDVPRRVHFPPELVPQRVSCSPWGTMVTLQTDL